MYKTIEYNNPLPSLKQPIMLLLLPPHPKRNPDYGTESTYFMVSRANVEPYRFKNIYIYINFFLNVVRKLHKNLCQCLFNGCGKEFCKFSVKNVDRGWRHARYCTNFGSKFELTLKKVVAYLFILICGDGDELGLFEDVRPKRRVGQLEYVVRPHQMKPRLVLVHRVQYRLQTNKKVLLVHSSRSIFKKIVSHPF